MCATYMMNISIDVQHLLAFTERHSASAKNKVNTITKTSYRYEIA